MASTPPATKPRKRPSESKLKSAAKHIAHDVRRLGEAYVRRGDALAYTSWYAFCRSLMDFVESTKIDPDDVLASDYFDDPTDWLDLVARAERPKNYKKFRTAVNKLTAHLTYSRSRYEGEDWYAPSAEITDYLVGLVQVFYFRLPENRKLWFGRLFR